MILFEDFVDNINLNNKLFEGGAYGHLMHPFEDLTLTFNDLFKLIETTIKGSFTQKNFVQAKTDGQNIMVSWKNNRLISARNKGHLKNFGANALNSDELKDKFSGRGKLEISFSSAIDDLENAFNSLSNKDKKDFFNDGQKFISLEIITPITQNTVPYGQNLLVFHSILAYDEEGNVIDEDKSAPIKLDKILTSLNQNIGSNFKIKSNDIIEIKQLKDTDKKLEYYNNKLIKIMKSANCNYFSSVYDYIINNGTIEFEKLIKDNTSNDLTYFNIDNNTLNGLIERLYGLNKNLTIANIKKLLPDFINIYSNIEKTKQKQFKFNTILPLQSIFIEIGTEVMQNISFALCANPNEATIEMRNEIEDVIAQIKNNGSDEEVDKLNRELERLTFAGGLDKIVPSEGITFVYNNKLYKYTGIFMILNQIRGMIAYKK